MRPTSIPAAEVWRGASTRAIAAPDGLHSKVAPVEAVIDTSEELMMRRFSVRCELEPGDLEALAAGGCVWLSFHGHVVPFTIGVESPGAAVAERKGA